MKFKKIKIKGIYDIKLGDIVFGWTQGTPYMVIKKGKTFLHEHLYVILSDYEGTQIKAYEDSFKTNEEILRFEWGEKKENESK